MYVDRDTGQLWLTPSDVTDFLGSKWLLAQRLAVARGERAPWPRPDQSTAEITRTRGDEHEAAYLAQLKSSGLRVAEIPRAKTAEQWAQSVELTRAAIADDSVDVVFQAHFVADGNWRGQADFLERNEQGRFEPVDTKLAHSVKPYMVHQLCFYADALAELTGELPGRVHVGLGDGRRETLRTGDFVHLARSTRRALEQFLEDEQAVAAAYPWAAEALELAGIDQEAEAIRRADDHLSLVAGITRKQIERLAGAGITTATELSVAGAGQRPKSIAAETYERLTRQARLQKTTPATWELLPPHAERGLGILPEPNAGDIFYDIEGDPLWDVSGSLEYLHGLWWIDTNSAAEVFTPLWAHDRAEEKLAFERLIEFFLERLAEHPGMHIYHYAAYETVALKRLARSYGTCEEELDHLLREGVFVDLFQVVRQSLQASVESYSIKSMERFYMDQRTAAVKEGGASIVEYERFRELAGTSEGQAILDDIGRYNEEDCKSTYLLREWLLDRREEAIERFGWVGEPAPEATSEDILDASPLASEPDKQQTLRNRLLLVRERLQLAADAEPDPARAQAMRLLAELLLFHAREGRSLWWSYFAHCAMSADELVDDGEALGGLTPIAAAGEQKNGRDRTFSYPPQDHKLKVDTTLRDPFFGWPAGKVVAIDDAREEVTIRLSSNSASQLPAAVFPFTKIGHQPIEEALIDLAEALLAPAGDRFAAAVGFLLREPPYFGEAMIAESDAERRELLKELEGSYLVAQGPPGTGKTYAAADLIVDQLISGKRVGVTAGTHLAIENLCDEVDRVATERGHVFTGLRRIKQGDEYESEHGLIRGVTKNEQAAPGIGEFYAGTAWLFSREEWHEQLDLLVIDEAGQFSLASTLAAATAAKSLLMVGDPNQLPQVTQGSHPIGSGASALEHVIGGERTIAPELGIFLEQSRRMTPELCEFVSQTFYAGRLSPHASVAGQSLPGYDALNYLAVEHSGNRQDSIEEAEAVATLVASVLEAGVPAGEVMVVAPFNMQVELVRQTIRRRVAGGDAVQVLTVDKCQGQTVDVVIYTLATSGGEEVPRGPDFLFSSNRFNVAISRARLAAFLVASPELLRTETKSVEAMRLLDAFIAFSDRATRI